MTKKHTTLSKAPKYKHSDIKYSTDSAIFSRALKLFESGKVGFIKEDFRGYSAVVKGTQPYDVWVSVNSINDAHCTCYMGQNHHLCKHVLALALAIFEASGKAKETSSSLFNLTEVKEAVNEGIKLIKPYRGPSKTWFKYQQNLSIGSGTIEDSIKNIPATIDNAKFIWNTIKRLDRKLSNGVDDSDGTVSGCVMSLIEQLASFAKINKETKTSIQRFCAQKTFFDFNEVLKGIIEAI